MKKKTRRALRRAVEAVSTAAAMIAVDTIGAAAGRVLKGTLKKRRRER